MSAHLGHQRTVIGRTADPRGQFLRRNEPGRSQRSRDVVQSSTSRAPTGPMWPPTWCNSRAQILRSSFAGGTSNAGVIYQITSSGTFMVLHNLNGATDGSSVGVLAPCNRWQYLRRGGRSRRSTSKHHSRRLRWRIFCNLPSRRRRGCRPSLRMLGCPSCLFRCYGSASLH
jgi:hypothetical protein